MTLSDFSFDWPFILTMLIRLTLAFMMGGLIGLERERVQRYAGLRTHILVCVGAALVMCTGEAIFRQYNALSSMDPARLGAQVVSGIGILCAGTILKEGASVRGLTTATSLWCASCIGLAVGSGNILPALYATLTVIFVLHVFRSIEIKRLQKTNRVEVTILAVNAEGIVAKVRDYLRMEGYVIDKLVFERASDAPESDVLMHADIVMPKNRSKPDLFASLSLLPEIRRVTVPGEESGAQSVMQ